MELKILEDRQNPLLGRREILVEFPDGAGRVSRRDAVEALASELRVEARMVVPIKFETTAGGSRATSRVYIYEDPGRAKRHLPGHIFIRNMEKEERKKAIDEKRKAKAAEKQAAAKK